MTHSSHGAARKRHQQSRRKRQLMILMPLLGLFAALAVQQFMGSGPRQAAGKEGTLTQPGTPTRAAASPATSVRPPLHIERPAGPGRDLFDLTAVLGQPEPTASITTTQPDPAPQEPDPDLLRQRARERFQLQAIMVNAQPRAMINGQAWRIGDQLEGWQLTAINQQQVVLSRDGVALVLRLNDQ